MELCQILDIQEIKKALWSIGNLKAPGVNRMSAVFFKKYLMVVRGDIIDFVQEFFRARLMNREINDTLIVLLRKRNRPLNITHYRPITCAILLIKLLLRYWLVILNGWIAENIIIVQEILHTMKKKKEKRALRGIKIDMSKVQDKLEWEKLLYTSSVNKLKKFHIDYE